MLLKHDGLPSVKWSRKKKKRTEFHLDFILQLTSISSSCAFCPFLTIRISHSFAPGTIYLKHTVFVTYQFCQSLPSLGSEALGLRHKSSLGNFLIEQKPGDTKPRHEMHQQFLGLGGELWEQPADKKNAQIKPFRWSSLSKHTKVANIFASWPQPLPDTKWDLPGMVPGLPEQGQALDFIQAQDITPSCHHPIWCHSFWFRNCFPSVSYNCFFQRSYPSKYTDTARQPSPSQSFSPCAAPSPAPALPGPAQVPPPSCPLFSLFQQK